MANFNKVILMGNVTRDVTLSYLPSQTAVVDFGLAINRKWTSKDGEKKEEVCFIDCRAFGKAAENINKYVHKGDLFMVEGRLSFEQWTAQDGSKKSRHRVIVDGFQFLQSKSQDETQTDEPQAETPIDKPPKDDDATIPF
jgi:single-strand DNA-binding protein